MVYTRSTMLPFSSTVPLGSMVSGSHCFSLSGRFDVSPPGSAHSRILMGKAPLGNPAASSELRLIVEFGPTFTVTTWCMESGLVATMTPDVSIATVPFDRAVAPACEAKTPTMTAVATRIAPMSWKLTATTRPRTAGCSWLLPS